MGWITTDGGLFFDTESGEYYDEYGNLVTKGNPTSGYGSSSGSIVDVANDPWTRALQSVGLQNVTGQNIVDVLSAAIKLKTLDSTQKAYLNINMQRAQQGLPPLQWDQFGSGASVGVALDSQTRNTLLLIGVGIVGALFLARSRN